MQKLDQYAQLLSKLAGPQAVYKKHDVRHCVSCGVVGSAFTESDTHKDECPVIAARKLLDDIQARQVKLSATDVVVNLGNMSEATDEKVVLDDDYEGMVEDYIQDFNRMVVHGYAPMKALFAMSQAFAIVLGCAVRAGLKAAVGGRMLSTIVKNADASSKMVKIITQQ